MSAAKPPNFIPNPHVLVFNHKIIPTNFQGLLLPCADDNEQNESKLMKSGLCIC